MRAPPSLADAPAGLLHLGCHISPVRTLGALQMDLFLPCRWVLCGLRVHTPGAIWRRCVRRDVYGGERVGVHVSSECPAFWTPGSPSQHLRLCVVRHASHVDPCAADLCLHSFEGNNATGDGGAVLLNQGAKSTVVGSNFFNNLAIYGSGGALLQNTLSSTRVSTSTFVSNTGARLWPSRRRLSSTITCSAWRPHGRHAT